ncbi:alkylation response protein AidB-like acyl-CoA dehydrogenase [Actinoplanes lutulentus]|uniref:Alkylation response protein AidB-like acyl-CoA dehydrogenase n=1 Tax=Actinoplanes lutulentus TaxID=1287878 RepID=A0A327Z8W4_9ACTN|nr:acyl-CoA dehydrogenase [Actinoplanes lutulentus]RAK30412.1 alkylation response protein AidB-like acyl-CoA dehydrogenase [Actinoplanes lutulentus]
MTLTSTTTPAAPAPDTATPVTAAPDDSTPAAPAPDHSTPVTPAPDDTRPVAPALDSAELAEIISAIAADARRRRTEAPGEHPHRALDLIRRHRLGAIRIPKADGGAGYTRREAFTLFIRLAEADPDVPHILRLHYGFVEELLARTERPWLAEILDGKLFGGAAAELGNRAGVYSYDTTLTPDGDVYRLNGRKFYSTGALYSDYLRLAANDTEGNRVNALIPADRAGISHDDDWDGIGQQHTGSGTTVLTDVVVHPGELLPFTIPNPDRRNGAQSQLLLHAIAAGILRELTADAADLVRGRTRSYSWGNHDDTRHDPQILQIVGELSSAAFVVEAAVLAAADALDRADGHLREHGAASRVREEEAALQASQVKVGVEEIALRAAGAIFGAGGASATRASHHLDRHWRNLRTLFSHNPTVFKARVIGDVVVNAGELPAVGYF